MGESEWGVDPQILAAGPSLREVGKNASCPTVLKKGQDNGRVEQFRDPAWKGLTNTKKPLPGELPGNGLNEK
jgi:hypothetical protein